MKSLLAIFKYKYLFLTSVAFGWLELQAIPKPMLLFWLLMAMCADLFTGLVKSWTKGENTSSEGFRRTVSKLGVYVGTLIGVYILANLLSTEYKQDGFDYAMVTNGAIGFITFIEIYSIFENIYEINPNSIMSRKLIKPIMRFLKGKIESNEEK